MASKHLEKTSFYTLPGKVENTGHLDEPWATELELIGLPLIG